jgi:hypothetical protein
MRIVAIILCTMLSTAAAAQEGQSRDRQPGDSPHSTGRSYQPTEGQKQPQGNTGPLETTTGGAPCGKPARAVTPWHAASSRRILQDDRRSGSGAALITLCASSLVASNHI